MKLITVINSKPLSGAFPSIFIDFHMFNENEAAEMSDYLRF